MPPSPEIIKGIPAGAESETNSSAIDSGDKWDKTEVGVFSCCPTLMAKIGPTWAEVHAAAQEEEVAKNQALTWDDIVSKQLPGGAENWDAEEDSQSTVEPQFEDTIVEEEEDEEQVVIESVMEEELEQPVSGEPLTKELDEDTIDTISQDAMSIHAGEDDLQ